MDQWHCKIREWHRSYCMNGPTCSMHQSYHIFPRPLPPSSGLLVPFSMSSRILANLPHGIAVEKVSSQAVLRRAATSRVLTIAS